MKKLNPKAVIFDLGSTLIEYEVVSWDQLNELCAERSRSFLVTLGHDVPDQDEYARRFEMAKAAYRKAASETYVEWNVPMIAAPFLEGLGIEPSPDFVQQFFDAYYQPVDDLLYAYPDTLTTLEWLRPRCGKIGLISNTIFPERAHRHELQRFGIEPYLDFALFSSSFGVRKPHPDIFRRAVDLTGFAAADCVYVGDRYVEDVVGPNGIGMHAILKVKEGREYPAEMPPDMRRISSLSDLNQHFDI